MQIDQERAPKAHALLERVQEQHDLGKVLSVMGWDREVNMPPAGNEARVRQQSTLGTLLHRMATSDELGALLEDAEAELAGGAVNGSAGPLLRVLRREYDQRRRLPADYVRRRMETSGLAHQVWTQARQDDDFAAFAPWLERIVGLAREAAEHLGYEDRPYDALLDRFEEGATTAQVTALFRASREALVPLREAIDERGRSIDDALLHQPFDVDRQRRFSRYIAQQVGYDLERGHIAEAVHPFASSFNQDDCRITTRFSPDFLNPGLFGTLHECGHAMYEQGTSREFARTPLASGTSAGIHESQSRMIENVVGRSRGFWDAHFPELQRTFPGALGDVDVADFHRAINRVQPSFIRVEADELTYNLHIILRFELEQALLGGDLAVADLPTAWNDGMRDLLGIVPSTDREGCLQDVHWSSPMFGYFPTYALGNLYAAQMHEAALAAEPGLRDDLAEGRVAGLVAWLRENVHRHGRALPPAELVERATGAPLGHEAFARYATAKFSALYELG